MKKFFITLALAAGTAAVALATDPDVTSRERWRVQTDTNTTTTASHYTAPAAGALLAGKAGGTNAVWIATAAGTNSWVRIALQ